MSSKRDQRHRDGLALQLAESLTAPADARDHVGQFLDALGVSPSVRQDVLLALSELVTNAVTHAGSAPRVQVGLHADQLRVEVRDSSARRPVKRASGSAAGGFGVRLVAELADTWGWELDDAGKVVWAQFGVGNRAESESAGRGRDAIAVRPTRRDR